MTMPLSLPFAGGVVNSSSVQTPLELVMWMSPRPFCSVVPITWTAPAASIATRRSARSVAEIWVGALRVGEAGAVVGATVGATVGAGVGSGVEGAGEAVGDAGEAV